MWVYAAAAAASTVRCRFCHPHMLPTPLGIPLPEAVGANRYPRGIPNWKTLAVGNAVNIHSIHSRPSLNEKKGTVVQAADPVTGRVGVLVEGEEQPLSLKRTNLALPGDTPVREERLGVRLPPDEDSIMGAPLSRSEQALQHFRANHTPSTLNLLRARNRFSV